MAFKAYSYSEVEHLSAGVHDSAIMEREKLLAAEFVNGHPSVSKPGKCPLCQSGETENFAIIGGAQYHRCANCWSLFVSVSEETVSKYREYEPLKIFRESEQYQQIAEQKRADVWRELLFWIEFRTARYLRPLKDLSVIEIGGRYEGFSKIIKSASRKYCAYRQITAAKETGDVILYLGAMLGEVNPVKTLSAIRGHLGKNGLLFLSSRVSTGFDVLTLKGNVESIFPYDCATIPSVEALGLVLEKAGFDLLEISTPGTLDMQYVVDNGSKLERSDLFTRYLVEKADAGIRSEFQRLLQKNAMSSHAQLVARACHE